MTKILAIALAMLCATATAQDAALVAATLRADGTTNTWTQADLTDALGLMNRKYWRDMETDGGRRAWHGNRLMQAISTNEQGRIVRVDVYADGYTHCATGQPRTVTSPESAMRAAQEARERALALLRAQESATLPPAVAALLQERRDAATTNEVNVVVEP